MHLENTIIYLIGFAGVGKYTIAKELVKKTTGARLVDNHLINNPLFSLIQQDGKTRLPAGIWAEVEVIRKTVIRTIRTLSPPHGSYVFTNVLYQDEPEGPRWYRQVARLAAARKAAFFPVHLVCSEKELTRRKGTDERNARFKEIDVSNIKSLLNQHELVRINHPNLLTLDVSELSASGSADVILEHVRSHYAD